MKKNTIICAHILCITAFYLPLHTVTVIDGTKLPQSTLPSLPPPVKDIIQSTVHQTGEMRPPLYINVNYLPNENNFVIGDSAIKLFFMRAYGLIKETAQTAATQCGEFAHAQELTIKKTLATTYQYINEHKIGTTLATIFAAYVTVQARILYLTRLLRDRQNWSLWHEETPLEEFFTLPPHQFCSDLLAEIQRRYATPNTAYDFVSSLTRFIKDADQEAAWLKEYKNISEFLVRCKIRDLTLLNQEIAAACSDRLQRLAYIKGTFLGWITEYRLGMRPAHAGGLPF